MTSTRQRQLTLAERVRICRCLRGMRLPCGCVAGRYLTYGGDELTVIDDVPRRCADRNHRVDAVLETVRTAHA